MVDVNQAAGGGRGAPGQHAGFAERRRRAGLLGVGTVAWVREFLATQAPGLAVSALCLLGAGRRS